MFSYGNLNASAPGPIDVIESPPVDASAPGPIDVSDSPPDSLEARLSMSAVAKMLKGGVEIMPPPKPFH
ncbi:hypothetical protein RHSIM_Rhsim11G0030800 [Rhododendron simsii]|uniref:Uncharacterized protein n=1 Tax=Rhododendron simsii TaxID=118357 RepID=A0A834G5G7_RHOSS|nr:hypothetical protein RHSIM_Rhsim11G0030800 [Rhododendron simsii]